MNKERNSNIEILRIISMLFIVVSHYSIHGEISLTALPVGINRLILEITRLGNIGVIIFILISGYYMIGQKNIQLKKILKLLFQVSFYSLLIYILFIILGLESFSIKTFIKNIFPVIFNKYWFATAYILLYLLSPFINKFLNNLEKKEHLLFLIVTLVLFSIIPTFTAQKLYGNELIQFMMFYSIGAYLRKYPDNLFTRKKINLIMLLGTTILLIMSSLTFDLLGTKMEIFNSRSCYFFNRSSILAILFSISLFNLFINKKEFNNKYINLISSCTFGVYLIHDNTLVREAIWVDVFKNHDYVYSNNLFFHMIICVIIVYIACIIIEYIRKNIIEKYLFKFLDKPIEKINNIIVRQINKI